MKCHSQSSVVGLSLKNWQQVRIQAQYLVSVLGCEELEAQNTSEPVQWKFLKNFLRKFSCCGMELSKTLKKARGLSAPASLHTCAFPTDVHDGVKHEWHSLILFTLGEQNFTRSQSHAKINLHISGKIYTFSCRLKLSTPSHHITGHSITVPGRKAGRAVNPACRYWGPLWKKLVFEGVLRANSSSKTLEQGQLYGQSGAQKVYWGII